MIYAYVLAMDAPTDLELVNGYSIGNRQGTYSDPTINIKQVRNFVCVSVFRLRTTGMGIASVIKSVSISVPIAAYPPGTATRQY
jgi:hypothetical protein